MALSNKAESIFSTLEESGDSQALGVFECLNTIAQNGDEQDTDTFLAGCADEIAGWAQYVATELRRKGQERRAK
jgi:hypothetical protein